MFSLDLMPVSISSVTMPLFLHFIVTWIAGKPCGEWLMRLIKYLDPGPYHCQQRPMLPMHVATT
jgi:hypothetical protein